VSDTPPKVTINLSSVDGPLLGALEWARITRHSFVIVEDIASERFVQFAACGVPCSPLGVLVDVPIAQFQEPIDEFDRCWLERLGLELQPSGTFPSYQAINVGLMAAVDMGRDVMLLVHGTPPSRPVMIQCGISGPGPRGRGERVRNWFGALFGITP
jgi:hypothetical protein